MEICREAVTIVNEMVHGRMAVDGDERVTYILNAWGLQKWQ